MTEGSLGWDYASIPHARCARSGSVQGFLEWLHSFDEQPSGIGVPCVP